MDTLTLPVDRARFNTPVPVGRRPRNGYDVRESMQLSTFHVPQMISFSFASPDRLVFELQYPNEEPVERHPRRADHAPGWLFWVGKRTRKLLRLELEDARAALARSAPTFSPLAVSAWAGDLPTNLQFACRRNAEVVAEVLGHMPEDIRTRLLGQAGPYQTAGGRPAW